MHGSEYGAAATAQHQPEGADKFCGETIAQWHMKLLLICLEQIKFLLRNLRGDVAFSLFALTKTTGDTPDSVLSSSSVPRTMRENSNIRRENPLIILHTSRYF